jgi:putative intracellular protease/amidase
MTADLYATGAGLFERSAAACVSGVPEAAADGGPFGPASVSELERYVASVRPGLSSTSAAWADRDVVVHGNLVTSRQPGDIPAFTREMPGLFAAARGA